MFWNNYSNFNSAMSGFEYQQHAAATYINYYPALYGSYHGVHANGGMQLAEKHGVGIVYSGDIIPVMTNTVLVNYNYQFDLKKAGKLSTGVGLGVGRVQIRKGYEDDYLFAIPEPQNTFQLAFGAAYKWKKLLLGVASTNLNQPKNPSTGSYYGPGIGINAHASYDFNIGEKFQLTPRALFSSRGGFQNLQLNVTTTYDERFALGFSLHSRDNYGVNIGWDIKRKFRVAYSYNVTVSKLNNGASGGVHEFSIGYLLKN